MTVPESNSGAIVHGRPAYSTPTKILVPLSTTTVPYTYGSHGDALELPEPDPEPDPDPELVEEPVSDDCPDAEEPKPDEPEELDPELELELELEERSPPPIPLPLSLDADPRELTELDGLPDADELAPDCELELGQSNAVPIGTQHVSMMGPLSLVPSWTTIFAFTT